MVFRLPIPYRHPLDAFAPLADRDYSLLLYGDGVVCIGADPIETLYVERAGADPFRPLWLSMKSLDYERPDIAPHFAGGWAGLASYELGRALLPQLSGLPEPENWPDLAFALYDTVAIFDPAVKSSYVLSHPWSRDPEATARAFAASLGQSGDAKAASRPEPSIMIDASEFGDKVRKVIDYIRAGDCFQANISHPLSFIAPDGPYAVFVSMLAERAGRFSACLRLPGKDAEGLAVVSNSPERFIRVYRRRGRLCATTEPIKGTRPRHPDQGQDRQLALELLGSSKDRAENLMIVDLMRNDLARSSLPGTVRTEEICGLRSYTHVHHLVSRISSVLAPGAAPTDMLGAAFPGGSITGAPKIRAMQIIAETENQPRGPYCGSIIWLAPDGEMDSSILIRTAAMERQNGIWRGEFRVGAGIVADSLPEQEYMETLIKGKALFGPEFPPEPNLP